MRGISQPKIYQPQDSITIYGTWAGSIPAYCAKINSMKPIAILCPNGIMKIFNPDGTRNLSHPASFWNEKQLDAIKKDFNVTFA